VIVNFSVQNFKVIKDKITLSFEPTNLKELEEYYLIYPLSNNKPLLKLALIYGPNASGKTTILEALDFLKSLVIHPLPDKSVEFKNLKPFLGDEKSKYGNTLFEIEFIANKVRYLYQIELNQKAIIEENLYRFKPKKALVYQRTTDTEKKLTEIKFGSKIKLDKSSKTTLIYNTLWNNTVLGAYLKINLSIEPLQEVVEWFKKTLQPLVRPKTALFPYISDLLEEGVIDKNIILKLLESAEFGITDFVIKENAELIPDIITEENKNNKDDDLNEIVKNLTKIMKKLKDKLKDKLVIKELYFKHFINNQEFILPFSEESSGTQRYYELCGLLTLMLKNNIVLPIDELEASLHPHLLKHFLLLFLKYVKNSQLIATTHYINFFLEKELLRYDTIWFTDRNNDGSTELFSLADFDTSVIRKVNSVYNFYKIGKLGAIPKLTEPYLDNELEKKETNS